MVHLDRACVRPGISSVDPQLPNRARSAAVHEGDSRRSYPGTMMVLP